MQMNKKQQGFTLLEVMVV
ncbi:MAG: prepilin-type N-terminal cleavage/methylation domain-containing protein, partial [Shewanella sp.]